MTAVYLDAVGQAHDLPDHLKLHPVRLDKPWNGFAVPVVTAAEFRRCITAWQHCDTETYPLYGLFYPGDVVIEADGALIYRTSGCNDVWAVVGMHDGQPVYALAGWQWVA